MFQSGDVVFIPNVASIMSMSYYAENDKSFDCPCKWRGRFAEVLSTHGNFVKVQDPLTSKISAFYFSDLTFVHHKEVE